VNLVWHDTAARHRDRLITEYSELTRCVSLLERLIKSRPDSGKSLRIRAKSGKVMDCRIKNVWLDFFNPRHSIGYDQMSAVYRIIDRENIEIIDISFT
jgi:hypothetical protein